MPRLSLDILTEERLRQSVDPDLYEHGRQLFLSGKVTLRQAADKSALLTVSDRRSHSVEIRVGEKHLFLQCDCLYAQQGRICEHDVAAYLQVRSYLIQSQPAQWRGQIQSLVSAIPVTQRRAKITPYYLFFSLQESYSHPSTLWSLVAYYLPVSGLPADLRADAQPISQDSMDAFLRVYQRQKSPLRSAHQTLDPQGCINCGPEAVLIANTLIERTRSYSLYSSSLSTEHLELLTRANIPIYSGSADAPLNRRLHVLLDGGSLRLEINKDEQGLTLDSRILSGELEIATSNFDDERPLHILETSPVWLLWEQYIIKMDESCSFDLIDVLSKFSRIVIPQQDEDDFRIKHLLPLARIIPLGGNAVRWETIEAPPTARIYLSEDAGNMEIQLRFGYEDIEVDFDSKLPEQSLAQVNNTWTLNRVHRQPEAESKAYESLASSAFGLKRVAASRKTGILALRARQHPVDFLLHKIPRLIQAGFEVYGEEKLKTARVNRNTPRIAFTVSSGIDWFDLQTVVSFGENEVALAEIRRAMRKRERYIKLADGTIGEIPEEWIERYRHLFAISEETDRGLRFSPAHLGFLDQIILGADLFESDTAFEVARQSFRRLSESGFSGIHSRELPLGFIGELRPYQKAGYEWLHFLRKAHFGGCLADDMGLGKTIQALVFLQSIYGSKAPDDPQSASLLIVPRSLLVNWQREAERFTPNLRILEYFDTERIKDTDAFSQTNLVITSYGVMLRDIELLHSYRFHYVILDESQAIKNPLSQTARAARTLQGEHKLVLTGTPIENSTIELWSQFAFLNPGLLGSLEYFKEEFGLPIENKKDENTAQRLRKIVYPFILRRTKDQVAPELPARTERILYADMQPAQKKYYARMRDYYRGVLLGSPDQPGWNSNQMKILEGLLRLRQISNHPILVDEHFHGESGKFELLIETLETLLAEKHKALVFSQFVQMLRLIRQALDQRHIPYAYLDGHTVDRQAQVDRFQTDEQLPFFLISLKAGGKGLNLTAADYVIHVDPWWNPAVEMQASDRTHRIGQEKPVFIYKLITRDSVEEKILVLQQQKKDLVEQIIVTDSSFYKSLTREDFEQFFGS